MTEKQKIEDVLERYREAVNTSNAEALASLYQEDAILLPADFPVATGKTAIHNFYAYAFSVLQLELDFNINPDQIMINHDLAYATTDSTGTRLIRESSVTLPEINRELWIFGKVEGDWKIARYMFNKEGDTA